MAHQHEYEVALFYMNADQAWKLQQARTLTGLRVPTDVLTAMGAFTMAPLEANDHPAPPRLWPEMLISTRL